MGSDNEAERLDEEEAKNAAAAGEEAFEGDVFNQEQNNDLIDDAAEQEF